MSLKRNTFWNLAGVCLPLILGVVTIPYLIRATSVETFGVLTLVWALIGYFSLFDFGLGRALTQQVAAARSTNLISELPSLVRTGLLITAFTGVFGGVVLAALSNQLAFHWLNISDHMQLNVFQALLVASIGIPLTTVTTGLRGILEGYEDFRASNLMRIGLGMANFGFPAASVMLIGNSLLWMVNSLVIARFIVLIGHICLVNQRLSVGWASAHYDNEKTRRLFSFGAWMTVTNIVGPLMVTADRFVVSAIQGANVVAYYTVPFEVVTRVLILPGALTSALFPRLSFVINRDPFEARRLYKKYLLIIAAIMLSSCLALAVGAKFGLALWLGDDFAIRSWMIVIILAGGLMLNGVALMPFAIIQASGDAKTTALLHFSELIIYVPLLFFAVKSYGLEGAAAAWTIRAGIDLVALLILANRNLTKI